MDRNRITIESYNHRLEQTDFFFFYCMPVTREASFGTFQVVDVIVMIYHCILQSCLTCKIRFINTENHFSCFVFTQTKLVNMEFKEFTTTEKKADRDSIFSLIQEPEPDNVYRISTTIGFKIKLCTGTQH